MSLQKENWAKKEMAEISSTNANDGLKINIKIFQWKADEDFNNFWHLKMDLLQKQHILFGYLTRLYSDNNFNEVTQDLYTALLYFVFMLSQHQFITSNSKKNMNCQSFLMHSRHEFTSSNWGSSQWINKCNKLTLVLCQYAWPFIWWRPHWSRNRKNSRPVNIINDRILR